jgi:hypothetical protein
MKYYYHFVVLYVAVILFCPIHRIEAETGSNFTPVYKPSLAVYGTDRNISINGDLQDPGWRGAAMAADFSEHYPGDQTKPPVETRAYITYDNDNLYIAFVCYDDPVTIRASYCERDKIFNDDNVRLCVDTYGDAAWAYIFYANPYGVQGDAIWASVGGEGPGYDIIWESAGIVTDSGYQVEMAIPFASLRFPKLTNQVWRVDFFRNHPRETQAEYSWAAYDRNENCWPCQWGTVSGITGVKPGRGIEITPTILGYQSGELTGTGQTDSPFNFANDDPDGELSVWGKYTLSSNATVEATVNPDFSQVEADAGQIDVNTTYTLYYPERRPFFQEGSDLFRAAIRTVYTRSINDPEFALKTIYRSGRTSLGYILARDKLTPIILPSEEGSDLLLAGKSTSNILRARRSIGEGSEIGMIATDQRFDGGGSGSSLTHDALFRLAPSLRARYHLTLSQVTEPDDPELTAQVSDPDSTFDNKYTRAFDGDSFWGYFAYGYFGWWTSTWNASFDFQICSPAYRQHNGFIRQNNYRYGRTVIGYFHRIPDGLFETINPHIRILGEWNWDGKEKYRTLELNLWTRLRAAQAGFYSQYVRTAENFGNIQFDDVWYLYQDASVQFGDLLQLVVSATYGNQIARRYPVMSQMVDLSFSVDLKPHDRLLVQQRLNYAYATDLESNEELYDGYIYRTRVNYQISKPLALRLVVEYDNFQSRWSIDPLLTYRLSAFSVCYIGSTYDYTELAEENSNGYQSLSNRLTSRQFFAKLQYLFQI